MICPKAKSATHCLTELFSIYQNKHGTIRRRDNHIVVQSSHRNIFKIDWFQDKFEICLRKAGKLVSKRKSYWDEIFCDVTFLFLNINTTVVTEIIRIIIENLMNIFLHKSQYNIVWKVLIAKLIVNEEHSITFFATEIIYSFRVLFASRTQFSGERVSIWTKHMYL